MQEGWQKKKKIHVVIFFQQKEKLYKMYRVQLFPKQCFVSSIAVHTVPWLEDLPCPRQVR